MVTYLKELCDVGIWPNLLGQVLVCVKEMSWLVKENVMYVISKKVNC
jgi:hypothetical protein